jgi:hypothetical protein
MPELPKYSYRDRIKFACFNDALNRGLEEEKMIEFFTEAAQKVRGMEKSAFFSFKDVGDNLGLPFAIGGAALLGPAVMGAAGHLGYAGGQGVRHLTQGYVPTPEEVHLLDEAEEYKEAVEDIRRRILLNRAKKQQSQAPSNRRMF